MLESSEFQALLRARERALLTRTSKISAHLQRDGEALDSDWTEQAQQRENDEVLDGLDDAGRAELAAIRGALDRLETGSFGICINCGDPIPEGRLRALPTASLCVSCTSP